MRDHYRWLKKLEWHWLGRPGENNQISYTMPVNTDVVTFQEFQQAVLDNQPDIRCCSFLMVSDWRKMAKIYGYVPNEPISAEEYEKLMSDIKTSATEEAFTDDELACAAGGACPVEPSIN